MSAKKNPTLDVNIMGRAYKVACSDDERDDLLAAVSMLDRKMNEIKSAGKVASAERIAVMAALNMAHELLQSRSGSNGASSVAASGVDLGSVRRRMELMQAVLDEALMPQEKLL
jgi:cell division protein ZapA